jgi:hypothetical protein
VSINAALLQQLTTQIAAVTAIVGVSADFTKAKSTWTIFPVGGGEVLASSVPAAWTVVQAFDPNGLTPVARIANGIAITSTGSPALNATYAIDPVTQNHITSVATYINTNARFPGGQAPFPWPDITGVSRSFQSTAQFLQFASACADIVTQIQLGMSPTQAATIV